MQTQGYPHSAAWKQSLALLDKVRALTASFENDALGMADRLRTLAVDLPMIAAMAFEQLDYENARAQAKAANQLLFKLEVQSQLARHLGLLTPRELKDFSKQIDRLEQLFAALPDDLFEDDGLAEPSEAA